MFETIAATAASLLITLLFLMYLVFRTPRAERPTGRLTRDLPEIHSLLSRLEPGDRILVTEKRGRTVGKRGGVGDDIPRGGSEGDEAADDPLLPGVPSRPRGPRPAGELRERPC